MRIFRQGSFTIAKTVNEPRIPRRVPRQIIDMWNDDSPILVGRKNMGLREQYDPHLLRLPVTSIFLHQLDGFKRFNVAAEIPLDLVVCLFQFLHRPRHAPILHLERREDEGKSELTLRCYLKIGNSIYCLDILLTGKGESGLGPLLKVCRYRVICLKQSRHHETEFDEWATFSQQFYS